MAPIPKSLNLDPSQILHEPDWERVIFRLRECAPALLLCGARVSGLALISLYFSHGEPLETPSTPTSEGFLAVVGYIDQLIGEGGAHGRQLPGRDSEMTTGRFARKMRELYDEDWGLLRGPSHTEHSARLLKYDEECLDMGFKLLAEPEASQKADSGSSDESTELERVVDRAKAEWVVGQKTVFMIKMLDIMVRLDGVQSGRKVTSLGQEDKHLAVQDLSPRAAEMLRKIAESVQQWWKSTEDLMKAEHLWPLFLRGILADAMDLNITELEAHGHRLLEHFTERLKTVTGPSPLANYTLREIIKIGMEATGHAYVLAEGGLLTEEERAEAREGDGLNEPASEAEIASLEDRLGTTLPDFYKDFLRSSNGYGRREDEYRTPGINNDNGMHPAKDVQWSEEDWSELTFDLLELPHEFWSLVEESNRIGASSREDQRSDTSDVVLVPPAKRVRVPVAPTIDRVLEIGQYDIFFLWLMPPKIVETVKAAYRHMMVQGTAQQQEYLRKRLINFSGSLEAFEKMEWCVVEWITSGYAQMTAYFDVRQYLERQVRDAQRWEREELEEERERKEKEEGDEEAKCKSS